MEKIITKYPGVITRFVLYVGLTRTLHGAERFLVVLSVVFFLLSGVIFSTYNFDPTVPVRLDLSAVIYKQP